MRPDLRTLSYELHPPRLERPDFSGHPPSPRALAREPGSRSLLNCLEVGRSRARSKLVLFGLVQECLGNIIATPSPPHHPAERRISTAAEIRDGGRRDCSPSILPARGRHPRVGGIAGMRERLREIDGRWRSSPTSRHGWRGGRAGELPAARGEPEPKPMRTAMLLSYAGFLYAGASGMQIVNILVADDTTGPRWH